MVFPNAFVPEVSPTRTWPYYIHIQYSPLLFKFPVVEFSKFSVRLWIFGRRTRHPCWFRHTPFLNRACEPWMDHDPLAEQQPPFLTRFSAARQRVQIIAQRDWYRNQILAQLLWPHCKSVEATTWRTRTPKRIVAERLAECNWRSTRHVKRVADVRIYHGHLGHRFLNVNIISLDTLNPPPPERKRNAH